MVNEKGEKYWYCPFCFEFNHTGTFIHKNYMGCDKSLKETQPTKKPLLGRLNKIESKTVWKKKRDGPKLCWLKTWVKPQ